VCLVSLGSAAFVSGALGQGVPDRETQQEWLAIMTRLKYVKNPDVQEILQLTEEQRESIARMRYAVVAEPGVPVQGTQEQLERLLDARQNKILRQLELQAARREGLREVLLRRDVVEELKITATQRQAMDSLAADYEKAQAHLKSMLRQKRADGADVHKLRQAYEEALLSVLTSDQRQQWDEMIGPPYNLFLPIIRLSD